MEEKGFLNFYLKFSNVQFLKRYKTELTIQKNKKFACLRKLDELVTIDKVEKVSSGQPSSL